MDDREIVVCEIAAGVICAEIGKLPRCSNHKESGNIRDYLFMIRRRCGIVVRGKPIADVVRQKTGGCIFYE
jgi:hypothetical protein